MADADEETRALAFRAQERRRAAALTARKRALAGSRSARAALKAAWEPLSGLKDWKGGPGGTGRR